MKYLKLFENYLINEYLNSEDNITLYKYFNMSDEEKKKSLPFEYCYLFKKFLKNKLIFFREPKHDSYNTQGLKVRSEPYNDHEIQEWLYMNNRKLFDKFANWLYEKIKNQTLTKNNELGSEYDYSKYPTWFFFGKPEIIKEQWLIHLTKDADSIEKKGFTHGMCDIKKLGLTTHFTKEYKSGGYNFSYTIPDFKKYGFMSDGTKYGKEVVIFRCSGVRVWHNGDEEYQTIFWGKLATHINAIKKGKNAKFGIYNNKNKRLLYENDNIEKIIDWFIKNYNQYKNYLN